MFQSKALERVKTITVSVTLKRLCLVRDFSALNKWPLQIFPGCSACKKGDSNAKQILLLTARKSMPYIVPDECAEGNDLLQENDLIKLNISVIFAETMSIFSPSLYLAPTP